VRESRCSAEPFRDATCGEAAVVGDEAVWLLPPLTLGEGEERDRWGPATPLLAQSVSNSPSSMPNSTKAPLKSLRRCFSRCYFRCVRLECESLSLSSAAASKGRRAPLNSGGPDIISVENIKQLSPRIQLPHTMASQTRPFRLTCWSLKRQCMRAMDFVPIIRFTTPMPSPSPA
jgi:hypothetical protein